MLTSDWGTAPSRPSTMEADSAPSALSLPPRAAALPAAAGALRDLLRRVDSTATVLWHGPGLTAALLRYQEVFLPMYAAHLHATGRVVLHGRAAKKADALVAAAATVAATTRRTARAAAARPLSAEERNAWASLSTKTAGGVAHPPPLPPLDVAFVWMLARLDNRAYAADCLGTFEVELPAGGGWAGAEGTPNHGDGVDAPATAGSDCGGEGVDLAAPLDHVWVGNATEPRAVTARLQWVCFAQATREVAHAARNAAAAAAVKAKATAKGSWWTRHMYAPRAVGLAPPPVRRTHTHFLPGYLWPPTSHSPLVKGTAGGSGFGADMPAGFATRFDWVPRPRVAALVAAAASQRLFLAATVGPPGPLDTWAGLEAATTRYGRYLGLVASPAAADTFLVPPVDVDLVWHAHLASTAVYAADMQAGLGRPLHHIADDDNRAGGRLRQGRAATAALWAAAYPSDPYRWRRSRAGATSPGTSAAVKTAVKKAAVVDKTAIKAVASTAEGSRGGYWPRGAIVVAPQAAKLALVRRVQAEAAAEAAAVVRADAAIAAATASPAADATAGRARNGGAPPPPPSPRGAPPHRFPPKTARRAPEPAAWPAPAAPPPPSRPAAAPTPPHPTMVPPMWTAAYPPPPRPAAGP